MSKKVREVLKALRDTGWVIVRQRGSHRQLRRRGDPNVVTVSGNLGDDMKPGTYNNILKRARLK